MAVEGGRARSVTLRNVPSFLLARDREVDGRAPTTWPTAATSTRCVEAAAAGMAVDPARVGRADRPRAGDHGRDQPRRHAGAPRGRADRRLPPRRLLRGRAGRRPQRDRDRARLAGPLAVRHGHLGADGGAARARRAGARRGLRQRVGDRHALHRPPGRGDDRRRAAGRRAGDHRPRVGDRDGPVPARRRATRSRRASPCDAPTSSCVGGGIVGACAALELARGGAQRRGARARRRVGRGLLVGQRRPARAQPRAADRGARGAARRAGVDGAGPTRRSGSSSSRRWRRGWLRYLRASTARRAHDGRGAAARAVPREPGRVPGAGGRGDRRRLRGDRAA